MGFMDLGSEVRRMIYMAKVLENVNRRLRKTTRGKGSWTTGSGTDHSNLSNAKGKQAPLVAPRVPLDGRTERIC